MNKIVYLFLAFFVLIIIGISGYVIYKNINDQSAEFTEKQISIEPTPIYTEFSNPTYGFKFLYPSDWQEKQIELIDPDLIYAAGFTDPKRLDEMEINDCLNNEIVDWLNPNPTKLYCEGMIASVPDEEKSELTKIMHEKDLYVYVFPADKTKNLKTWLTGHYRSYGGELGDFVPEKEISLNNLNGYAINIACCEDYNMFYVVSKGDYIYQFGTSYSDGDNNGRNTLLDEFGKNFLLY